MLVIPVEKKIDFKSPPWVLMGIIAFNVLIFIFYQTMDASKINEVVDQYIDSGLAEQEWPLYRKYFRSKNDDVLSQESSEWLPEKFDERYVDSILFDRGFDEYLEENQLKLQQNKGFETSQEQRAKVIEKINTISFYAFGLIPEKNRWFTYLSHQFLHGGVMHLLGNMVFLILFGFAVESALGSWRFLLSYIVGGFGAAGFHCGYLIFTGSDLSTPMVGASGAISAVMAMYVVLFRLRTIEFFYWIFMVAGYFRAPALILLPIYIIFEVLKSYLYEGSNVAYMAHIGGYIAGTILVFSMQAYFKDDIDEAYLDGEKEIDPYMQDLDEVYKNIALFKFQSAFKLNDSLAKKYGKRPEIEELHLNLLRGLSQSALKKFLLGRLNQTNNLPSIIQAQVKMWRQLDHKIKDTVPIYKQLNLAIAALKVEEEGVAKKIYTNIAQDEQFTTDYQQQLIELNSAFSKFYQTHGQVELAQQFAKKNLQLSQGI